MASWTRSPSSSSSGRGCSGSRTGCSARRARRRTSFRTRTCAGDRGTDRCRRHRALARLGDERRRFEARPADATALVDRFIAATVDGDVTGLEAILTEDAAIWADGGGKAIAAREPIFGRSNAAHYLAGLAAGPRALTARLSVIEVNAAPAILVHESGNLTGVLVPEIRDGAIARIRAVLNPDKLTYLRTQLDQT